MVSLSETQEKNVFSQMNNRKIDSQKENPWQVFRIKKKTSHQMKGIQVFTLILFYYNWLIVKLSIDVNEK